MNFFFKLPPYSTSEKSAPPASDAFDGQHSDQAPPLPSKTQNSYDHQRQPHGYNDDDVTGGGVGGGRNFYQPPTYQQSNNQQQKSNEKSHPSNDVDDFLGLPAVPDNLPNLDGNNRGRNSNDEDHSKSIDFDELARRFENLKSKK